MKLPKYIIVLGKKYSIKQEYDLHHNNLSVHGVIDFDKKTIRIDSEQNNENKLITLIHEIGHAVAKESALQEAGLSNEIEEIFVEQMAKTIIANLILKKWPASKRPQAGHKKHKHQSNKKDNENLSLKINSSKQSK